jgi:hypothetical protein
MSDPIGQCLRWPGQGPTFSFEIPETSNRTMSDSTEQCLILPDNVWLHRTMSNWRFLSDVCSQFWPYFANRVSVWSYSSSTSFITLWGSFLSCWLVLFITFLQGFWTWVIGRLLAKEFDSALVHPPLRSPPSVIQMVSEPVRSLVVLNRLCD